MALTRIPRLLRVVLGVAAGWFGVFVVVNVVILLVGVVARWSGKDPQLRSDDWPGITHLRQVDDHLLVGGQTTLPEYKELAEHGVTLVLDVRPGGDRAGANRNERDNPEALREIGLDYVSLPIPDGRAPTPDQIRRFLELVDGNEGRVFAHCGGGVGRSTSLAAAYEAAHGQDPSVMEQLAVGPPTLEQIWFVGTLEPNHPEHGISPVVAITSRVIDAPRTLYGYLTDLL
jgi:uncharacterized protein (TIGR01244 family)